MKEIYPDAWHNLYGESWKGVITEEAFAHPAKYSRALIRKIYEHLLEENLIQPGATVLDPFGGVALGGLNAMRLGLHWVGVELEEKFYTLGQANLTHWQTKFPWFPGAATLMHGDSRNLIEVIRQGADMAISSPPYAGGSQHTGGNDPHPEHLKGGKISLPGLDGAVSSPPYANTLERTNGIDADKIHKPGGVNSQSIQATSYGKTDGQLGAMPEGDFSAAVSSPPYAASENDWQRVKSDRNLTILGQDGYGATDGQLGNMKEGNFAAAISSPPYAQARIDGQGDEGASGLRDEDGNFLRGKEGWEKRKELGGRYGDTAGNLANLPSGDFDGAVSSPPYADQRITENRQFQSADQPDRPQARDIRAADYGQTAGQLGCMETGDFDGAVSSPPFEKTLSRDVVNAQARREYARKHGLSNAEHVSPIDMERTGARDQEYGQTEGQLGNDAGDSFWLAARQIVTQVYTLLAPGAPAVWVVKDYVRNKQIVPFCDQWRQLCEAVGFETLHLHHAWLVEEKGTQLDLFGKAHTRTVERKSFFRRLAEKKGSPRIDWETVICMQKPKE